MKNIRKKGFTLIELLIVIAIIGVLASIVVVSLSNTTGDAQEKKSRYNVAQAARALAVKKAESASYTYNCADVGAADSSSLGTTVGKLECHVTGSGASSKFIVYEKYGSANTDYFCADNDGDLNPKKKTVIVGSVTGAACP